jgi:hypothetical protein
MTVPTGRGLPARTVRSIAKFNSRVTPEPELKRQFRLRPRPAEQTSAGFPSRLLRLRLRALSGDTTGPELAMPGRDVGKDRVKTLGKWLIRTGPVEVR